MQAPTHDRTANIEQFVWARLNSRHPDAIVNSDTRT